MMLRPSQLATAVACALLSVPVLAEWTLDNEASRLSFVSTKNASKAELHHFRSLSGAVDDSGSARLRVDLDSVETLVPIRNERMRELLFETVRFPAATLTAQVPESVLALQPGESLVTEISIDVELHGASKAYPASVLVSAGADGLRQVLLREPLLVDAADFGLDGGIGTLREVAGLTSISTAVPVTAHLVFHAQAAQ
jgi:hypothetical protein